MVKLVDPPANGFVGAMRRTYSLLGFSKRHNFVFLFIVMGSVQIMSGYCKANCNSLVVPAISSASRSDAYSISPTMASFAIPKCMASLVVCPESG